MLGLSVLGIIHTLIGAVALAAGAIALIRYGRITPRTRTGLAYIWVTFFTAVTSLFIFHHGGFGNPHILAIMTIVALVIGMLASRGTVFGRGSRYVEAIAFTSTFLFHLIPGFTETGTRFPRAAPAFTGPEDPTLQKIYATLLVLLVVGLIVQLRWLKRLAPGER